MICDHQSELTRRVIESAAGAELDATAIDRWASSRRLQVVRTENLLAERKLRARVR